MSGKTEGISQDSFVESEAEFGSVASTRCIDSDCKLSIFSCDLCQLGIAAYYIVKECRSTTTLFDIVEKCNRSGLELINMSYIISLIKCAVIIYKSSKVCACQLAVPFHGCGGLYMLTSQMVKVGVIMDVSIFNGSFTPAIYYAIAIVHPFLPPAAKLWQGNVLHLSVILFTGGCLQHSPEQTPTHP